MTDSAIDASQSDSSEASSTTQLGILDQILVHSEQYPDSTEFWIETEASAAELLISLAASLKLASDEIKDDPAGLETLQKNARIFRRTVANGKALMYLREIPDEEALAVWGLRIRARRILLH